MRGRARSGVADRCGTGATPPTLGRRRLARGTSVPPPSPAASADVEDTPHPGRRGLRAALRVRPDRDAPPARADPARRGPRRRRPRRQPRHRVPGRGRDARRACRRTRLRANSCGRSGTGSSRPSVAPRVRSTAPPASRPGSAPATPRPSTRATSPRCSTPRPTGWPDAVAVGSATRRSSTRSRRPPRRSRRARGRCDGGGRTARAVRRGVRGMHCTRDLVARRGLAMRLGERSVGHRDPGAVSCLLLLCALGGR